MIDRAINWNRFAQRISRANQERHFKLEIEARCRTESRHRSVGRFDLALWPPHIAAADYNRAGASVIRYRQPLPIWHPRVFPPAPPSPHVVRMVIGRTG